MAPCYGRQLFTPMDIDRKEKISILISSVDSFCLMTSKLKGYNYTFNEMQNRKQIVSYLNQFHLFQTLIEFQCRILKFCEVIKFKLLFIVDEKLHLSKRIGSKRDMYLNKGKNETFVNQEEMYNGGESNIKGHLKSSEQLSHLLVNENELVKAVSVPIQMFIMPLVTSNGSSHLEATSQRLTLTCCKQEHNSYPACVTIVPAVPSTSSSANYQQNQIPSIEDYLEQSKITKKYAANNSLQHSFRSYLSSFSTTRKLNDDRGHFQIRNPLLV